MVVKFNLILEELIYSKKFHGSLKRIVWVAILIESTGISSPFQFSNLYL